MKRHTLVAWTGPTAVKEVADQLRYAGVTVKIEGTENVFIEVEGANRREVEEWISEKIRLNPLRWLRFRALEGPAF